MVDFRKKLGKKEVEKKIIPLDIYNELDRRSITGPLRPAQSKILDEWFNHKQKEHNLIIKLHTGEGKTLIGLLILQSKINQGEGPCFRLSQYISITTSSSRSYKIWNTILLN